MGDRGYNAGGFAYMTRVWCPRCGISYPVGRRRFDRDATNKDGDKPKLPCMYRPKCDERVKKKAKRSSSVS